MTEHIIIRDLGMQDYQQTWQEMREFTDNRTPDTADEIWLLQHPPVFTQGQAGKPEHVLNPGDIPVIQTDRGGQVTYHGPGQLVAYILYNLRRNKIGIRDLVMRIEKAVINTLSDYGIEAKGRRDAPGVYVNTAKICSLGLRVRRGCSYHGLALNIDMALEPFTRINPCGMNNIQMTQIADFLEQPNFTKIAKTLTKHLENILEPAHS